MDDTPDHVINGASTTESAVPATPAKPTDRRRKSWFRRHKVLTSLLSVLLVFLLGVGGFAWWLNHSLSDIKRIPVTLPEQDRPVPAQPEDINLLFMGTDAGSERNRDGRNILEDAASGSWPAGKYRSDATMVVHIPADKSSVTVMAIPRDSYVTMFDNTGRQLGKNKINAALSLYGPSGAIATVENLTNLRIDHIAMVDWDGFRAITDALGGVTMTTDTGTAKFGGQAALDYVRERYTVKGGDFGRIQRQQNFMRAVVAQLLSSDTVTNPVKLTKTVSAVTKNLAVDQGWTNGQIRSLALSMRSLRTGDIRFLTVPVLGTGMVDKMSIVRLDDDGVAELFGAVDDGSLDSYLELHSDLLLPPPSQVD